MRSIALQWLAASNYDPAGANPSSPVATGRLHASNTIAVSSLSPSAYKVVAACNSSLCLPEPAVISFHTIMPPPDGLRQAAGAVLELEEAPPVHVLRPSVVVRYLQHQEQDGDVAEQESRAHPYAKDFLQGLLVLIILGAHGIHLACMQA